MKKIFLLVFIICFTANVFSQDYVVTSVAKIETEEFDRVRVILNNYLVVENIKFFKDGAIEFPFYENKFGVKFTQIEILDTKLEFEIINFIKTYQEKGFCQLNEPKFEIKDIVLFDKHTRKASVNVVFDDKILVVCGVMAGKKGDWIAWPASRKFDGKYHKNVYLLNSRLKEKTESAIFEKYKNIKKIHELAS